MSDLFELKVEVNGRSVARTVPTHLRLLQFLRDDLRLTGAKEVCGEGECGACTVLLNGESVNACLIFAVETHEAAITTIEGLSPEGGLNRTQQAFVDHHSVQCGYCIPGMILSAEQVLSDHGNRPAREDIRLGLVGNICRCTGYQKIFDAVESLAGNR